MSKIMSEYSPPEYKSTAFNCPYCGAYAEQTWWYILPAYDRSGSKYRVESISIILKKIYLWMWKSLFVHAVSNQHFGCLILICRRLCTLPRAHLRQQTMI